MSDTVISGVNLKAMGNRKSNPIENMFSKYKKKQTNDETLQQKDKVSIKDAIIIYLGGYHNRVRRKLLNILYNCLPKAEFLHFGDIDAGGLCIYKDLCIKTGIPFSIHNMSIEILIKHKAYGKSLTSNDKTRLSNMLSSDSFYNDEIKKLIRYMLENNIKLEQECIDCD